MDLIEKELNNVKELKAKGLKVKDEIEQKVGGISHSLAKKVKNNTPIKGIKFHKKDYSKYAWPSRLTAPIIKIDLVLQCRRLPKKDLLSQADAFCVLWQVPNGYTPATDKNGMPTKLPGRQETEIGRTDVERACVDPTFTWTGERAFRLAYKYQDEQTFAIRVYDEDLRYATDLKEHDYIGGCVFTLGQLMGAKGCTLARRLGKGKSFIVITGEEIVETREVLEFRFSCQDLIKQQSVIDQSKVLDKSNPYFRVERLNKDDQSWEVVWKSEVIKDSLSPTWKVARLPLQLLCNDDQSNPLKVTIWDHEKHSTQHDQMGFVESTVAELVNKSKEGIPVFMVMREKKKLFGGSKLKRVGLFKVLKATILTVPSMMQYLSGGCSLDLMVGIDCTQANGSDNSSEKSLHYCASNWLNDYQAGIQRLGLILENFARGRHSSMWGFGATIRGEQKTCFNMAEKQFRAQEYLASYDATIVDNPFFELGGPAQLKPIIEEAMFRSIRASQKRQCYYILCIMTAGNIVDVQESINIICTAAEDAPLSIVLIGVGNGDFSSLERLVAGAKGPLKDSRGVPIAREIVRFVTFKQFQGNATEVISSALKEIPEQFVQYFMTNGFKPLPPIPPPDFAFSTDSRARSRSNSPDLER